MYKYINRNFWLILALLTLVPAMELFAEGSGNWKGEQTGRETVIYVPSNSSTSNTGYGTRGYMMLPSNTSGYDSQHRFYVYVKAGETVFYSFRRASGSSDVNWYYDNRANGYGVGNFFPSGTSGTGRTQVNSSLSGLLTTTTDLTQAQALAGPAAVVGSSGYATSGNNRRGGQFRNNTGQDRAFWVEMSTYGFEITDWDVTVASENAGNYIVQKGRVYSKYWSIKNGLPSGTNGQPNNSGFHDNFGFYVPVDNTNSEDIIDDYYIKYVNFGRSNAGYAVFFANDSGPLNNTLSDGKPDIEGNRKSITGTSNRYQYPLFVAEPDESIWKTSAAPIAHTDVRFRRRADATGGEAYFLVEVDTPGSLDILVDLDESGDYSAGDVQIFEYFDEPGAYEVYWDGKDANGVVVPSGTKIKLLTSANFFPVHFPVYDMEQSLGVRMENIRPVEMDNATVRLFWDHSKIYTGNKDNNSWNGTPSYSVQSPAVNTTGVDGPNNIWWASGNDGIGNDNTMNVYAGSWMETLELEFSFDWDQSDIEVKKSVDNTEPIVGSNVTFTIEVINHGLMFAQDITVNDLLPSGFQYISHIASMGSEVTIPPIGSTDPEIWTEKQTIYDYETGLWTVYDIPYNADDLSENKRELKITARVLGGSGLNYTNKAEGYPEVVESDPNLNNNISQVIVTPITVNITIATDDFVETDQNEPVSGNVLDNDYDPEGHIQTVTTVGTFTTFQGGQITLASDGSYTYTPPADYIGLDQFEYEVCDNGSPQACDNAVLLIGVGVCTEEVIGQEFKWEDSGDSPSPLTKIITQPSANYGFVFDIYELDNSFNMQINGTKIADYEIEFQSNLTSGINVEFADGDKYEANTTKPGGSQGDIWEMRGDAANPLIRVVISPTGGVSLYGSKDSYGELFPLVLTSNGQGQNKLNNVPWNSTGENEIIVIQNVVNVTIMDGYGYGQNWTLCPNYWIGGTEGALNEWSIRSNWTDNRVPGVDQTVEFATADNNNGNPAVKDLHLDNVDQNGSGGRIIGNLINNSSKDLVITAGNQLTINGSVIDNNPDGGTILVKSINITTNENEPTGTLLINSENNPGGVKATVEFYNKAYDCADCGYYTRSWQYFGVPVVESGIIPPFTSDNEVNQWYEPTNGNKWITPNIPLTAFTGYQVTRNTTAEPDFNNAVHIFDGLLNINNASIGLTRTFNVNYSGANLIANSYTAAIPIAEDALSMPSGVEKTVYLFNTGTRDQWRKLNGNSIVGGVAGGQYLAVPINLAGQPGTNLPDRIPSMHTFMVLLPEGSSSGNLEIVYDKLVKNTTVNRGDGTQIVTRSANSNIQTTTTTSLPYMMVDVIGEKSADRLWIFVEESTSHGFDSGWDGRKMTESGIAQLYVEGSDESLLQVATVPTMDNVALGFAADADGKYTLEFLLSEQMSSVGILLHNLETGARVQISNGTSYSFEAKEGEDVSRFSLSQIGEFVTIGDETLITVEQTEDGKVVIRNGSGNTFSAFISNANGAILNSIEVVPGSEEVVEDIDAGIYVIRLQNAVINDVRRLIVK